MAPLKAEAKEPAQHWPPERTVTAQERAGMAELTEWLLVLFSNFLLTIRWPFSLVISVNLSLSTFSPVPLALYNV